MSLSDPCKFVGVEGEQCNRLHQVLESNPCRKGKTKRAPSTYNLYIKACLGAKGGVKKFGEAGPKMRECATEYNADKAKGKFRYHVEIPASGGSQSPALWKGRDLQAEFAQLYGRVSGKRK